VPTTTVLLTGENGFLGSAVHAALLADPRVEVNVLGRRLGELELGDQLSAEVVIHLAAWTTKRAGSSDLEQIVEANVVGFHRLLRCLDPPPRRLLFASTVDVYGAPDGPLVTERSPLDPTDAYAASKLLGEHMSATDAQQRGYQATVVRIGHLYGPGEDAYEKFVPTCIKALMRGRPPTVIADGETRRDLLYVDDAAEGLLRLALSTGDLPDVVNLASSGTHTLKEIAQELMAIVGFLGRIRYLSDQPRPTSIGFDTQLLDWTIGELDQVSLPAGLRREVEHVVALERASRQVTSGV
jgi:nucleoside-diphosphate-sugar epimerase